MSLEAKEFLYPVGYHPEDHSVYVVYQKSSAHLELWEWDPETRYAHQLLLSRYSPAGFQLLPDLSGFSFVDNGVLKIKKFLKRSPRRIEFDGPISEVELVQWINSSACYSSAKYNDYYGIFQIDWEGCVVPILYQESVDFLYPQKIDDILFCIERSERGYHICQASYCVSNKASFSECMQKDKNGEPRQILFFEEPVAFLKMISPVKGFVLGYKDALSKNDQNVSFDYYQLSFDSKWTKKLLFSFSIPTRFLLPGSDRLYESMLPLLPYICNNEIYFVDSTGSSVLSTCVFSMQNQNIRKIAEASEHLFGIVSVPWGSEIFFGGQLGSCIDMVEGVYIQLGRFKKLT